MLFHPLLLADLSYQTVTWLIAIWIFAIGGAVGSFLNVVVYRLPAGMSLVRPGSHCPACKHPVRWYDNLPMLGWIVLRGRCRDCGAAISARYPIVEAVTAVLFLVLAMAGTFRGGANLPLRGGPLPDDVVCVLPIAGTLLETYLYHLLLLCTLLAATLIEYDGHRLPWRLFMPAGLGGVLAPLACPLLRPVPATGWLEGWVAGLVDGVAGLAVGTILGLLAWLALRNRRQLGTILGPMCVGLFLGYQAAAVLTVFSVVLYLLLRPIGRRFAGLRRLSPVGLLGLSALGWILAWAELVTWWPLLG